MAPLRARSGREAHSPEKETSLRARDGDGAMSAAPTSIQGSMGIRRSAERRHGPMRKRTLLWINHDRAKVRDEPLRHAELPLQRGQMRSPTHALSNESRQLRQARVLRCVSTGSTNASFAMRCVFAMRCIWVLAVAFGTPSGSIQPCAGQPCTEKTLSFNRSRGFQGWMWNLRGLQALMMNAEALPAIPLELAAGAPR